mgnify:CR=1 FL=1
MSEFLTINNKIKPFNKKISIEGDKSLSIRWALLASQAIGKSRAMELTLTGDFMGAEEAANRGLVSKVVPRAESVEEGMKIARKIATKSKPSTMMAKECIN